MSTSSIFARLGFAPDDAEQIADYFVWVELHALAFVGARRIPELVERVRAGGSRVAPSGALDIVRERPAFAIADAGDALAQVCAVRAMNLAIEKARDCGVGVVVLRNVTTAGALGYYADRAAEQGMIGLAINNTPAVMAAEGSAGGVIGAQPFAIAAPAGAHPSLRLDMTNSVMSMVRMWELHLRDEPLPEGVALDADGRSATDPMAALAGTLLPMGHRGYALALMLEVLTGVLGGAQRFAAGVGMPGDVSRPMAVSMFLLAIDPAAAMDESEFRDRVDQLIDHVHAAPTRAGVDRVLVPGERSHAAALRSRRDGIRLTRETAAALERLGVELGVPW